MLRLVSMAMQQSGKGPGEGKAPALSDEQADQFAASFTPAWDSDEGQGDDANAAPPTTATVVDPPAVAPVALHKQTLMGQAPPANPAPQEIRPIVPSSEAIDPENILESNTAPQPPIVASSGAAVPAAMKTQMMQGAPGPVAAQAKTQPKPAAAFPVKAQPQQQRGAAAVALSADPFKHPDDDDDVIPKKSSKTLVLVIAGLAFAAALGLFVKFATSDDPPKPATTTQAVGPAVATAEIPPPPPKVETPPAPVTPPTTAAAKTAEPVAAPLPAPLPAPTTPSRSSPVVEPVPAARAAPAAQPRPTRPATQPPQAAAAPPPLPAAPKTPPKTPNTGIVHDNPF